MHCLSRRSEFRPEIAAPYKNGAAANVTDKFPPVCGTLLIVEQEGINRSYSDCAAVGATTN